MRKPLTLFSKRFSAFKKIRRGYYSLFLLTFFYSLSFFLPLLVNNKALMIFYKEKYYFPAFQDLLSPFYSFKELEASLFNQKDSENRPLLGEPDYRKLKKTFKDPSERNRIILPPYPYSPVEHLLEEISGSPPTAPDSRHFFGTDGQGRDVFARLVYGFRISMTFALWVTLCSFFMGTVIGAALGYFGRWVDLFGVRCIEIFSGIPFLYMTMILSSFLQPSFIMLSTLVILMGGWIGIAYYMRGEFYREKAKEYVLSAKALGAGHSRIMFRHILPNAMTPLITFFPFALVGNIGALVSLDFMGLGLKAPTPSWGELLNQGAGDIQYWWLVTFPLSALFLTLLMITFIGESLRDAFDPKPAAMIQ